MRFLAKREVLDFKIMNKFNEKDTNEYSINNQVSLGGGKNSCSYSFQVFS